jgi:hypothetical protein
VLEEIGKRMNCGATSAGAGTAEEAVFPSKTQAGK